MKFKIWVLAAIFCTILAGNASAEDRRFNGEISLTAQHLNIAGEKAKFNEYRDIGDGLYGDANLQYESGNYYLDFRASDAGRKTQNYELYGGKWGSFRYNLIYDQLPHNFTYGARSFYTGIGGPNLSYTTPPTTNIATWSSFDYEVERRNYKGGFKLDSIKPFYCDVSIGKETRRGIYPLAAAGTTPGGIAIELPAPISYTTDSYKVEAGYAQNPLFLSFSYFYTKFTNDNEILYFQNPASTATVTDALTLAPNNDQYKLNFQGALKLPLNSKFNVNISTARAESENRLLGSYITATGTQIVNLSDTIFNGKVDTHNYSFVFTTNPLHFLDAKVFYHYYRRDNKSDQIVATVPPSTAPIINPLFGYRKEKLGANLGFRLPASFYINGGYSRINTEREREDNPKNNDDLYHLDLRWSGLDFMMAKFGYERLNRRAHFNTTPAVAIELYEKRFDVAAKTQDAYKASLEFFPLEDLNFTLGYKYKDNRYQDTVLGLRSDKRNEYSVDADYLILKRVKLFGYFDLEYVKFDQYQRQLSLFANSNPNLTPTANDFNWRVIQTEKNYAYGVGTEIFFIPKKLSVVIQHNNQKSNGHADYTYYLGSTALPAGRTQDNIDIREWDDYRLTNYIVKAIYHMTSALSLTGGWAYEKYVYEDAQYNGYQYVPATTGTNGAFLTGAYKDPSYRVNVFFLSVSYKF
jgi:MtrB/PioB family decaheme-associated outer membrane protein